MPTCPPPPPTVRRRDVCADGGPPAAHPGPRGRLAGGAAHAGGHGGGAAAGAEGGVGVGWSRSQGRWGLGTPPWGAHSTASRRALAPTKPGCCSPFSCLPTLDRLPLLVHPPAAPLPYPRYPHTLALPPPTTYMRNLPLPNPAQPPLCRGVCCTSSWPLRRPPSLPHAHLPPRCPSGSVPVQAPGPGRGCLAGQLPRHHQRPAAPHP